MKTRTLVSESESNGFHFYAFSSISVEGPESRYSGIKIKEIEDLAHLPVGWDFGMGGPTSKIVIEKAKQVFSIANLLQLNTEIIPQTAGGIIFNFYKYSDSEDFLEVTVNSNLSIDCVVERGKGINYEVVDEDENIDLLTLQAKLSSLSSSKWNWSERSTSKNTQLPNRGSVVIVSPFITAGYPSFKRTVRYS